MCLVVNGVFGVCPNSCNFRGTCSSPIHTDHTAYCMCQSGAYGAGCEKKARPRGDDPLTTGQLTRSISLRTLPVGEQPVDGLFRVSFLGSSVTMPAAWADNNDETCSRAISSLPGVLSASCEQKDVGQLGEATYVVRFHAWDPEPVDAEAPHLGNPALDLFGCESTLPGDSRASGRDACFHVSSILGVVWKGSIPTSVSDGLTGGPADVARDRRREER